MAMPLSSVTLNPALAHQHLHFRVVSYLQRDCRLPRWCAEPALMPCRTPTSTEVLPLAPSRQPEQRRVQATADGICHHLSGGRVDDFHVRYDELVRDRAELKTHVVVAPQILAVTSRRGGQDIRDRMVRTRRSSEQILSAQEQCQKKGQENHCRAGPVPRYGTHDEHRI